MWRTLVFGLALIAISAQVKAAPSGSPECALFRQNIIDMENTSVRPPGWARFDGKLRMAYVKQCLLSPTRKVPDEYWYRADGTPLGVRADYSPPGWDPSQPPYRPDGGAFIATPEIAAACAQTTDPSLCAMAKELEADCRAPVDTQERSQCAAILNGETPDLPQPAEPLPSIADQFGPARPGAPRMSDAQVWADPGFRRMCVAANANNNTCRQRQLNMRSIGTSNTGSTGQAGAFLQCQQIYGAVLDMCHASQLAAGVPNKTIPANPPTKPASQQAKQTPPQQPKPVTGGSPAPPPADPNAAQKQQALAQMSPQCRAQLNALLQGADAGDQAKASAAYDSLRGQQCDGAMHSLTGTTGLGMPERVMSSRSQELARRALAGDEGIVPGRAAAAAAQGGGSYDIGQVLDFGIALLGAMNGIAGVYAPMAGGAYASRMGSIGNRPVQHTYGQGAPIYRTPRNSSGDITGTK